MTNRQKRIIVVSKIFEIILYTFAIFIMLFCIIEDLNHYYYQVNKLQKTNDNLKLEIKKLKKELLCCGH